jgi:hypothetical protein
MSIGWLRSTRFAVDRVRAAMGAVAMDVAVTRFPRCSAWPLSLLS